MLFQVLEKENKELEEEAKKILNQMSAERVKLNQLMAQLSTHVDSPACKAHSPCKKEFLKLQQLCGLQDSNTLGQHLDNLQASPKANTSETGLAVDIGLDLEEFFGFHTPDQVLNAAPGGTTSHLSESWLPFNSCDKMVEAQDPNIIGPSEGDFACSVAKAQSKAIFGCENVADHYNLDADSELTDFFDLQGTLLFPFETKDQEDVEINDRADVRPHKEAQNNNFVYKTRANLDDFKIQLKNPSPLTNLLYQTQTEVPAAPCKLQEPQNFVDIYNENSWCQTWGSTNAIDVNLTTAHGNCEQQNAPSYELPAQYPNSVNECHKPHVMTVNEKNDRNITTQVQKDPSINDMNVPVDQNTNSTEDIFYYEINSKKLEEINKFEPVEDDLSDILDIHQAKQSMILKNEMHNMYVGSALSPNPHLQATLTSTLGVEGFNNNFHMSTKHTVAGQDNNDNLSSFLQENEIDFYTRHHEECVVS